MIRKLLNLLFIGFVLHLLISIVFILSPNFFPESTFSRIYKTYLLPGPFFRDDRITTSYNLTLSWKKGSQWSEPINPLNAGFNQYYENFDPTYLYLNRYMRAFNHHLLFAPALRGDNKSFNVSAWYLLSKHYPSDADSVQVLVTRKLVKDFEIKVDTIMQSH